ncbi:protein XRI1 isoform X1 [Nicotiana tabacum]|uniref:Protein XRI1 isoform X1 n=2 Tax=Nicotiana tabacum TaxID=4097 RepID=A0A1S3YBN1_TOBAC|nr:PREDICTED: protein XRI1-like isoform X1 [Nicotiana tabacum]
MNFNNESDMWRWRDSYGLGDDPDIDISECLLSKDEEDISFMFDDENTPVKSCGDLTYHVNSYENNDKESQRYNESSSQVKRRRMLQFESEASDAPLCSEELSSSFIQSQETENSVEEFISEMSQWVSGFSEGMSSSGNEGLDQSSEGWVASCFNDSQMHLSPEDIAASDIQLDISEICNTPAECESNVVQERPVQTRKNVVFKGRKSYMRAPPKVASSVVYPFSFVKPCGVHGDVTLKDINQRIRTPKAKTAQNSVDPCVAYPKSAFSGKPVVGKTTIPTEGGKGSITIMRTKG